MRLSMPQIEMSFATLQQALGQRASDKAADARDREFHSRGGRLAAPPSFIGYHLVGMQRWIVCGDGSAAGF